MKSSLYEAFSLACDRLAPSSNLFAAMAKKKAAKKKVAPAAAIVPTERIERAILLIRQQKVMLDADLAELYGVTVGRLNEVVKRKRKRFPAHFMFQLTPAEWKNLKSQIAISSSGHGGRRTPPYAFTERGVGMLSSVLNSERAIQVNIAIMDTFFRLREMLASHAELGQQLAALERKYDAQFKAVFKVIRQLIEGQRLPPKRKKDDDDDGSVH